MHASSHSDAASIEALHDNVTDQCRSHATPDTCVQPAHTVRSIIHVMASPACAPDEAILVDRRTGEATRIRGLRILGEKDFVEVAPSRDADPAWQRVALVRRWAQLEPHLSVEQLAAHVALAERGKADS